jgi:hypothetical protein
MRSTFFGLTTLLVLLWTGVCFSQSVTPAQPSSDSTVRQQPRLTTLLARSDMQRPKPLPTIRPLRFEEIPVNTETPGSADKVIKSDSTDDEMSQRIERGEAPELPFTTDGVR